MIRNYTFSRWWGPVIGTLAGAGIVAQVETDIQTTDVIYGAIIGAVAGCFILLFDAPKKESPTSNGLASDETKNKGAVVGRILSILGLILFFLPPIGIAVSIVALVMNWRVKGWPKVVAWIGVSISSLLLLLMFGALTLARYAALNH